MARSSKKSVSSVVRSMSDSAIADAARSLSDKDLATAMRRGSEALHKRLLPHVMGSALEKGEIVIADGDDLPPRIRAANASRIARLPKAEQRAFAVEASKRAN